jgi:hypothetical protein
MNDSNEDFDFQPPVFEYRVLLNFPYIMVFYPIINEKFSFIMNWLEQNIDKKEYTYSPVRFFYTERACVDFKHHSDAVLFRLSCDI